jgi:hypothetical protein
MHAVRDDLSQVVAEGVVHSLARRGWRRDAAGKRLWERHRPPALEITEVGVEAVLGNAAPPRTLGDDLLIFLAVRAGLTAAPPESLLCRLAWPRAGELDLAPLFTEAGRVLLDALQGDLAEAWAAAERTKETIVSSAALAAAGDAEQQTLDLFLARDDRPLAGFLLDAAARIATSGGWRIGAGLDPDAPLGERRDARRRATALLQGVRTWRRWHDAHRGLGFVDEGFAAAQPLLGVWQCFAPHAPVAAAALAEVESL